ISNPCGISKSVQTTTQLHKENKQMAKRIKAYKAAAAKVEDRLYAPAEAIALAQEVNPSSKDTTVEVAMRLSVDPRKADQMVRGTAILPHGTGKTARVVVFATGDN